MAQSGGNGPPRENILFFLLGSLSTSEVGNALHGDPVFGSVLRPGSALVKFSSWKDRLFGVVQGPVIGNALERNTNCERFSDAVARVISEYPDSFLVFLLVFRSDVRFTSEDAAMVRFAKKVLGERLLSDFTIIVMTGEETPESQRDRQFSKVETDCKARVLSLEEGEKLETGNYLIRLVDLVDTLPHSYSQQDFDDAQQTRQRELVTAMCDQVRNNVNQKTSVILSTLDLIRNRLEPEEQLPRLQRLKQEADELFERTRDMDRGTLILEQVVMWTQLTCRSVDDAIANCKNFKAQHNEDRVQALEREVQKLSRNQCMYRRLFEVIAGLFICVGLPVSWFRGHFDTSSILVTTIPVSGFLCWAVCWRRGRPGRTSTLIHVLAFVVGWVLCSLQSPP